MTAGTLLWKLYITTLLREIKEDQINGKSYNFNEWEDPILLRYQFFLN